MPNDGMPARLVRRAAGRGKARIGGQSLRENGAKEASTRRDAARNADRYMGRTLGVSRQGQGLGYNSVATTALAAWEWLQRRRAPETWERGSTSSGSQAKTASVRYSETTDTSTVIPR